MKKILCIHGIGGKERTKEQWQPDWKKALSTALDMSDQQLDIQFLDIDLIFTKYQKKHGIQYLAAVAKLTRDWIAVGLFREERALFGSDGAIRWYAGMVVQFVEDEALRNELSALLKAYLDKEKPDLIFCHSLGTLISYDFLRQEAVGNIHRELTLVTLGSQIGHPALLKFFGGRLMPLNIQHWFNLHNPYDYVFAYEPIDIYSNNYTQIETVFKQPSMVDNHEPLLYITNESARLEAWPQIKVCMQRTARAMDQSRLAVQKQLMPAIVKQTKATQKFSRKALLVGINDYPNPENQLNGCVNDVFRMSEVLQEIGYDPSEIKVVLNERATSQNLRRMMDWLLQDARDGDVRFFFYSGHGAQIPSANLEGDDNDHLDECLVTYDFDWKRENAYTDKEFLKSYSKLSYGVNFITVLDCCHSGGMTRDAGFKARGLNPPDDIRHRTIKWDSTREMWVSRELKLAQEKLFAKNTNESYRKLYTGEEGGTQRFGRAISLWSDVEQYGVTKKKYGTIGPYMPLLIEACREKEYSYEYKHGVSSFGAFTYSLTTILRQLNRGKKNKKVTFAELVELTSVQLKELGYAQTPQLVGPKSKVNAVVPFLNI